MLDAKITGLTVKDHPTNERGYRILAYFDCKFAGIGLNGCQLMRTPNGHMVMAPPSLPGHQGQLRAIRIQNEALRLELVKRAFSLYQAMGGTDDGIVHVKTPGEGDE